jgi:hypothetical protein
MKKEITLLHSTVAAILSLKRKRNFALMVAILMIGLKESTSEKIFQNAITITRNLGKRFLWIDSLCIVQNHEKWHEYGKSTD